MVSVPCLGLSFLAKLFKCSIDTFFPSSVWNLVFNIFTAEEIEASMKFPSPSRDLFFYRKKHH